MSTTSKKTVAGGLGGEVMKAVCAEVDKVRPVGIRVPKGCGFLRATAAKGRIVVAVEDVVKGDNVLAGCGPYTLIEAGVKAKNHAFVPSEHPVTLKAGKDAPQSPTGGVGGHGHTGETAVKAAGGGQAKGKAKEQTPKVPKEPKAAGAGGAQAKWEGFSISSVLRWMGKDGWKAKEARAVAKAMGWKAADPSIRLQIASGRQGIRGEIADLSAEQAKELRAKRDGIAIG